MFDLFVIKSFLPETFLSVSILFHLVINVFLINNSKNNFPILNKEIVGQLFFILICLFFLILNNNVESFFYNFLFVYTVSNKYIKLIFILICIFTLLIIVKNFEIQKLNFFEYFSIFLIIILSLLLLIDSADLLSAYILIEIQALSFYILACFKKNSAFSTEAGIKYFVMGSFISGIYLFGCSLIYGLFGTLNFHDLSLLFFMPLNSSSGFIYYIALIGIISIIFTFFFKISSFPFQFWAPDVYEGAPLASTVIFSIIPKLPVFHFLIKWLVIVLPFFIELKFLFFICGLLSIAFGSLWAIRQKRIKRLVILSSIAQVGFVVLALANIEIINLMSIYFFLIIYLLTAILTWLIISNLYFFKNNSFKFNNFQLTPIFISNLSYFFKVNSTWTIAFILLFFSIAGIPPFVGFLSKIFIILSVIAFENLVVTFFLVLFSSISVYYYIRLIKITFFEIESKNNLSVDSSLIIFNSFFFNMECLILSLGIFCLLFFFFNPNFLILICHFFSINIFII